MSLLTVDNLWVSTGQTRLLEQINLTMEPGELVAILGSNGAGKSTLLKCIAGLRDYDEGVISYQGNRLGSLDISERARCLSYLPQERPASWPLLVRDVVALGRFSYGVKLGSLSANEQELVSKAMADCNLSHLAERTIDSLSGGEQARVHCARTFVTEAPILLADEPTTSLDPKHQIEIMTLLQHYVSNTRSALVVLHDPALAARFADRLIWLKQGRIVSQGTPAETLTRDTLEQVYDINAEVVPGTRYPAIEIHGSLNSI